jgi:hypothetical protein
MKNQFRYRKRPGVTESQIFWKFAGIWQRLSASFDRNRTKRRKISEIFRKKSEWAIGRA